MSSIIIQHQNGVAQMNLGDVKDHSIDAFGDAYEYLMSMYASNAGKSGGEYYTPADVSELLTRLGTVGKTEINKVYDPACGSGSLLLKVETVLGKDAIRNGYYGQESGSSFFAKEKEVSINKYEVLDDEMKVAEDHACYDSEKIL